MIHFGTVMRKGMKMNRSLTKALVTGLALTGLGLAGCTETPETALSWGVNDHLGQAYQAATGEAHTYVYDESNRPLPQAAPRPAPTTTIHKAPLPPIGRDVHAGTAFCPTFDWPANGKVISNFGATDKGERNDGIDIAMKRGAPIRAAAGGTVSYSGGALKEYGNLLLIRHDGGYVTAYAHAEKLLVKRGDAVKQGQVIAYAGQTGDVKKPQLHFEIRQGTTPLDPDSLLSPRNS
jgi:murein DD-endopeptidase MepM/ murein hydrolase activator NlpD